MVKEKETTAQLIFNDRAVRFSVSSIVGELPMSNRTGAVTVSAQKELIDL